MRIEWTARRGRSSRVGRAAGGPILGALIVLAASPGWACAQPAGAGARAEAAPLARYVPRQDLISYLEFQGLDAHRAAWQASAANKVLNETRLGSLLEDVATQLIAQANQAAPQRRQIPPADLVAAFKHVARLGFAVAIWGKDPDSTQMITVIRGGGRPELLRAFEAMHRPAGPQARGAVEGPDDNTIEKAGRTLHPLSDETTWWVEKDDLILTTQPDAVLAVLDGKAPAAADHPLRLGLLKGEPGFEPVAIGFVDLDRLPPLPPELVRLGLDGVKRIDFACGLEGEVLRTEFHAASPSPRRGLLALLDQPTFDANTLPPIPAGVHGFLVASVDVAGTYDRLAALYRSGTRQGPDAFEMVEDRVRAEFAFDLRKDVLAGLGPGWTFAMQNPGMGGVTSRPAAMINRLGGATLAVRVRDQAALTRAVDPVIKLANRLLGEFQPGGGLAFRREDGDRPSYVLDLPQGLLPPPFATLFRPTIILGKEQLVLGASGAAAVHVAGLSAARPDGRWHPEGAFVPVMRRLPSKLVYLRISDPRETMPAVVDALPILARTINAQVAAQRRQFGGPGAPETPFLKIEPDSLPRAEELIPRLFPASTALVVDDRGATLISREPIPGLTSPAFAGLLFAALMPATQSAREAARRAQCTNNLKQIALAYHNVHSATNAFPAPAITDKDGKPLLSWRVTILPYLEQQELYNKFHLDEPWDSPHNKALIKEMPAVYLCPSRKSPEPGTTTYRVFVGGGALNEEGQATGMQTITDGTSNTILTVESTEAVPWTRPDDLKFDPAAKPSLYGAGSRHPGGFNAGFADGSVRFISNSIDLNVWKALITRAGGEVINVGAF